ncbi:MAG: MlaE family ABC transporter permease [Acidobacteriota bacterium]
MIRGLRAVGSSALGLLADTGGLFRLALQAVTTALIGPFRGERVRIRPAVVQCLRAGYGSAPLVMMISFLVGIIMALQSAYQLRQLGALDLVGSLVAISVTRELAPLLTAIIVAGRIGSSIAAELGTMTVSRELDALVVMGIDPIGFLVVPRLAALLVSMPCLVIFADIVGILGGMAIATLGLGMSGPAYLESTREALVLQDVYTGLVKAVAFAGIIGLIGCHQGLGTTGGAEEVGRSTTTSVVRSIVLVIVADLFVTALFYVRG